MLGLLGSLLGGQGGRMIGGLVGGRTGAMIGGLAGAVVGGRQIGRLGDVMQGGGGRLPDTYDAPPLQESDAEVLIRAMCNAAKADGQIDDTEHAQILSELPDLSPSEEAFLHSEITIPHRPASAMARVIPADLRAEAYTVSLIAINVDTAAEADYLRQLAPALGLSDAERDAIHDDLGVEHL